jgi:hypothetical protein
MKPLHDTDVLRSMHRDPSVFPCPDTFLPERWLETPENGEDLIKMAQYMMPFGTGSRVCGGQNFAQMTLRIAVAVIARNFDVEAPPETNDKTMEMRDSFVRVVSCVTSTANRALDSLSEIGHLPRINGMQTHIPPSQAVTPSLFTSFIICISISSLGHATLELFVEIPRHYSLIPSHRRQCYPVVHSGHCFLVASNWATYPCLDDIRIYHPCSAFCSVVHCTLNPRVLCPRSLYLYHDRGSPGTLYSYNSLSLMKDAGIRCDVRRAKENKIRGLSFLRLSNLSICPSTKRSSNECLPHPLLRTSWPSPLKRDFFPFLPPFWPVSPPVSALL